MPEKYKAYVIPQEPGTIEDILARVDIGSARLDQLRELREREKTSRVNRSPFALKLKEAVKFNTEYPELPSKYILNLEPQIPQQEIDDLVIAVVDAAKEIFREVDLPYPQRRPSPVLIVDDPTFNKLALQELGVNTYRRKTAHTTLPNRIPIFNKGVLDLVCQRSGFEMRDVIGNFMAYDIFVNVLSFREIWVPEGTDPVIDLNSYPPKRFGLVEASVDEKPDILDIKTQLQQGFCYILYLRALANIALSDKLPIHRLDLFDPLATGSIVAGKMSRRESMGFDVMMRATFTPDGLDGLKDQLNKRYGGGALNAIINNMHRDPEYAKGAASLNIPYRPYQATITFLNSRRIV